MQTLQQNWTLHQNVLNKNAQPQSQQCHKGKPKQAHQIIIPEQPNEWHKSADKSDGEDNIVIVYQMCAQPEKNVNSQKPSQVTQRSTCILTFLIGSNPIINKGSIYMYNLTIVLLPT